MAAFNAGVRGGPPAGGGASVKGDVDGAKEAGGDGGEGPDEGEARGNVLRVLNGFAYTGGSTLAAARAVGSAGGSGDVQVMCCNPCVCRSVWFPVSACV